MIPQCIPMAPTRVREPFHREGWVYEEKVDDSPIRLRASRQRRHHVPTHVVALDVIAFFADVIAARTSRNQLAAFAARLLTFRLGIKIAWMKFSVGRPARVHHWTVAQHGRSSSTNHSGATSVCRTWRLLGAC